MKKILILIFLVVLLFPSAEFFLRFLPSHPRYEKRKNEAIAKINRRGFFDVTAEVTRVFKDFFPLKDKFLYYSNRYKYRIFGVSGVSKVVVGKEKWLFMNSSGTERGTVDSFRGADLFEKNELEEWGVLLEKRRKWLADRGIKYLFVIVPNKNTIYPEYMPEKITRYSDISRKNQLLKYLDKNSKVETVDLEPLLLNAKKAHSVFYRTDTHWNDFGAFTAYKEIVRKINSMFGIKVANPLKLSDFVVNKKNSQGGDIARMLFMNRYLFREDEVRLSPRFKFEYKRGSYSIPAPFAQSQAYTESLEKRSDLKVFMVHDSFYKKFQPYFSQTFKRVLYIWDWNLRFYPELIKREKPDIVIDELAERFLMDPPKGKKWVH